MCVFGYLLNCTVALIYIVVANYKTFTFPVHSTATLGAMQIKINSKKSLGRVQLEKKIGKLIFIHSFITFLGEHLNVNNVINALLCLCSCFYVHVFLRFSGFFFFFFWIEGWVGGVYRIQTCFGFVNFFYIYKAP